MRYGNWFRQWFGKSLPKLIHKIEYRSHTYAHTYLWKYMSYIYIFVVVNFDALAQASDFRIESCLPLLNAGFEPRGSLKPNFQQTECLLTNRLSYRGSS